MIALTITSDMKKPVIFLPSYQVHFGLAAKRPKLFNQKFPGLGAEFRGTGIALRGVEELGDEPG